MPARRILPIYLAIIALLVAGLWKLYPLQQMPAASAGPPTAANTSSLKARVFRTPFEAAFDGEQGFKLVKIVDLGGVTAVIGQRQGGEAHVDAGDTSIRYVRANGRQFVLIAGAQVNIHGGSWGRSGDISIRHDLSDYPMAILNSMDGNAGCYETWVTLIELAPTRPHDMAFFPYEFDDQRDFHPGRDDWGFKSSLRRSGPDIILNYSGDIRKTIKLKRINFHFVPDKILPKMCG